MRRPSPRWLFLLIAICTVSPLSLLGQAGERVFLDADFSIVGGFPPSVDPPVLSTGSFAGMDGSVYMIDHSEPRVTAFDWSGEVSWSFGRHGSGPFEFRHLTDLQLDASGNIWVADVKLGRVTKISPSGEGEAMYNVPGVNRVLPLSNGFFLGLFTTEFAQLRDEEGNLLSHVRWPSTLNEVAPMAREVRVSGGRFSAGALVAFHYSGTLLGIAIEGEEVTVTVRQGIESIPFPEVLTVPVGQYAVTRVEPQALLAATGLAHDSTYYYVLFEGRAEHGGRLVDLYDLATMTYKGSILLPQRVERIGVVDEGVIGGVISDPIPHLRLWRWRMR